MKHLTERRWDSCQTDAKNNYLSLNVNKKTRGLLTLDSPVLLTIPGLNISGFTVGLGDISKNYGYRGIIMQGIHIVGNRKYRDKLNIIMSSCRLSKNL